MLNRLTRLGCSGIAVLLILLSTCGCASKTQSKADARTAYLAGQRDAYAAIAAAQRDDIRVIGPVQNPDVPWVDGLTLAQAIATATYIGPGTPHEIILLRRGESANIDPKDLLNGQDVPLQPGDMITLR